MSLRSTDGSTRERLVCGNEAGTWFEQTVFFSQFMYPRMARLRRVTPVSSATPKLPLRNSRFDARRSRMLTTGTVELSTCDDNSMTSKANSMDTTFEAGGMLWPFCKGPRISPVRVKCSDTFSCWQLPAVHTRTATMLPRERDRRCSPKWRGLCPRDIYYTRSPRDTAFHHYESDCSNFLLPVDSGDAVFSPAGYGNPRGT